jgi:DNA (cytosine-5)-methyltransferase 1
MYKVLDLFCGCGGMSWGLHKTDRFKVIAGIDIWDIALKTFQKNHKEAMAYNIDISTVNPEDIMDELGLSISELDVIIGGPPCQGFSKNTPASWRFLEDPKNQLFRAYLRFVEVFKPKVVIMENVAEMFNAYGGVVRKEIIKILESFGYDVNAAVVNMSDYGVPQRRRRCVFFGALNGNPLFPKPQSASISAWNAISDLPKVEQGEGYDGMPYDSPSQNLFQEHMRKESHNLHNHIGRKMQPAQTKRIASIGPGQGLKDLPPELQVKGGYSGAYGRLDYTMIAPTITRWVFHIGSGRFAHPREVRGLTMREAARIQSFSDDFIFLGSANDQAGQIGNAVPPYYMEQLADNIIDVLEGRCSTYRQLDLFQGVLAQG